MAEATKVMTLDDVMKLEGRSLDAAVAEHAMGWTRQGKGEWTSPGHGPDMLWCDPEEKGEHDYIESPEGECYYFCPCRYGLRGQDQEDALPHFSTDWNAAMQVREWGRDTSRWADFLDALQRVINERPGWLPSDSIDYLMWFEPIDLCRAALLASP